MTNEFKKISQGDVTRYVLENASGGGTSAGSVASVSMPIGGMQRRKGDNLIAQEGDKKKVPASTPRNFVAKNAKTAGAGAHKDKSKTIPRKEKHKKPFMEDHSTATGGWGQGSYDTYTAGNHGRGVAENPEWYSDEANSMSSSQLKSLYKHAMKLRQAVKQMQAQGDTLEPWQQSKVTKAADYLDAVFNAVDDEHDMGEEQDVAEGLSDTIYPNAEVIKSKNGKPVGEIYQDGNSWGAFHYRADRGYDFIDSREEAIEALKDLHQETGRSRPDYTVKGVAEEWSKKYKSSINCSHPKGFSQKAHCAGKKKHNEDMSMEAVCPDCGMCQTHGNNMMEIKQRLDAKCWKGKHKEGTKIKGGVRVNNCVPNESVDPYFESLQQMVERQLEPTMDLDTWVDNFQNADPNKYHQFKNKTPEKKK